MWWFKRRCLKKYLKSVNWKMCEHDPEYKDSGEFHALIWLKAYCENRAAAEPREIVESFLRNSTNIGNYEKGYLSTILKWV